MFKYAVRRILFSVPTMFITITIIFFILRILPGDPVMAILGETATEENVQKLTEQLNLHLPIWQQYLIFLGDLLRGDLGTSMITGLPVTHLILSNFPHTFQLALLSIIIAVLIGIPLGILAAMKQNTIIDHSARLFAMTSISSPPFFLGIIMMLIFSLTLNWFPSMGTGDGFFGKLEHLFLPALTMGLLLSASQMRFTRASMLDEVNQDYVRTARSKGVSERKITVKHVLRNSLIPVITIIGMEVTSLLSGTVLIETVFSRPGLGTMAIESIQKRDFPVLQSIMVIFTFLVVAINLIVDISYSYINPRVRPR